ncbi:CobW family GTP-binding protein [Streptomyces sp. TRM75563]|uniref:CobW family GTP-binding protein n=1 Tax=Streptomyces sp. TRM75563 TaxID=2817418 RepID=UPI001F614621|nr:CobW family GTP-binding protein [Streptomyces sp. TRM75563]MCI4045903.1 GTP-binding protein [Streptomyces sp. TRM75563]
MTPPRTPQIPVVVLAGFLGSGKTTLLNHLLRNRAGTRIGVIVNDFGAIEIDAMTVSGQVGSTVSLGNGCLCCAVDASELDTFLETLTRPSARLDVIVIEASGLAEPQELVRMLLASDNPHILYGGLVEVVDAAEFDSTRKRHPELDRHLAVADLVVLNKTDRVGEAERERLRATVAELSGPAAVISAVHGRIDPELFFDPALRPDHEEMAGQLTFEDLLREEEEACDGHEGHGGHGDHQGHGDHLHASYESVDFTSDVPLDPRRFMAFLDSRPEGLYRIKGFADFGAGDRDNTYALHAVGRFLRFVPRPWARGEQRLTQLVMIGAGIDAGALLAGLAACRADESAPGASTSDASADAVERGMWGVLRYVQEHAPEQEAAAEA